MNSLGIYIHIPFCKQKCLYCDFLSFPGGEEQQALYFDALKKEILLCADECRDYAVDTVFIGGGTPTYVKPSYMAEIMELIRNNYNMTSDAEISMECNPGTDGAGFEAMRLYRNAGINRISIGLQSPNDKELKILGRIHNRQQFDECYKNVRAAGFSNVNVDLMGALPGQSLTDFEDNLNYVLSLDPQPEHISAYSLIIEEGTPFYEMYGEGLASTDNESEKAEGALPLPDEDTEREMYHRTKDILSKNGYHRYEISNYAKDGRDCLHNVRYWKCRDYLGFGLGAASLLEGKRFHNTREISTYTERLLGKPATDLVGDWGRSLSIREEVEELDIKAMMEEFMFMGLRMISGVDINDFSMRFGADIFDVYGEVIADLIEKALLERNGDYLRLTDKGLDVSNYCMAEFLI